MLQEALRQLVNDPANLFLLCIIGGFLVVSILAIVWEIKKG